MYFGFPDSQAIYMYIIETRERMKGSKISVMIVH